MMENDLEVAQQRRHEQWRHGYGLREETTIQLRIPRRFAWKLGQLPRYRAFYPWFSIKGPKNTFYVLRVGHDAHFHRMQELISLKAKGMFCWKWGDLGSTQISTQNYSRKHHYWSTEGRSLNSLIKVVGHQRAISSVNRDAVQPCIGIQRQFVLNTRILIST